MVWLRGSGRVVLDVLKHAAVTCRGWEECVFGRIHLMLCTIGSNSLMQS